MMGRENWGNTFRHQHSGVVTVSAVFQPILLLSLPPPISVLLIGCRGEERRILALRKGAWL